MIVWRARDFKQKVKLKRGLTQRVYYTLNGSDPFLKLTLHWSTLPVPTNSFIAN